MDSDEELEEIDRMHGADDAEVIDDLADVRKKFTDMRTTLAVLAERKR